MKRSIGVAIALALASSASLGQSWTKAAQRDDKTIYAVDLDTIRDDGPVRKVWIKHTLTKAMRLSTGQTIDHCVERIYFRCAAGQSGMKSSVCYHLGGRNPQKAQATLTFSEIQVEYTDVVPETFGQSLMDSVCSLPAASKY